MAITYPLAWPDTLTVNALKVIPRVASQSTRSSFSFKTSVINYTGQVWELSGSMPLMERATAEKYITFAMSLKGMVGTFLFPVPDGVAPIKPIAGTPLVDGGSQTGSEINIKGLSPSIVDAVPAGTWLNIGTRAYKTLTSADSDISGNATLDLWPDLRDSPSDNAAISFTDVKILCRSNSSFEYDLDINKHYFLPFSAMEAL